MSVKLRLSRIGKKKQPYYRIVAIDSKSSRDGSYLDKVGHYNPVTHPAELTIDRAKALKWLNEGALPSDTVNSLFRKHGILHEWDLRKRGLNDEQVAEELGKWQDLQIQRGKREEAMSAMARREGDVKKAAKSEAVPHEAKAPAAAASVETVAEEPAAAAAEASLVAEPVDVVVEEVAPAAEEAQQPAPEAPAAEESGEPKGDA